MFRPRSAACVALASLTLVVGRPAAIDAAEIKILCSNGLRAVMQELVPAFERTSHHTVSLDFGPASALTRRIAAGEAFDLAILTPEAIDALVSSGRVAGSSRTMLARSPLALAMKQGAARPDLDSPDAFARTLRAAKSLTYATQGASAKPFEAILERLGLTAEVARKFKPHETGAQVAEAVRTGEVEYGVIPLSEILPVAGISSAGVFPAALRSDILMVAAISTAARDATAAAQLILYVSAPSSELVLKTRGMERP